MNVLFHNLNFRLTKIMPQFKEVDQLVVRERQKRQDNIRYLMVMEMHDVVDITFCIVVALKVKYLIEEVICWRFALRIVGCNWNPKIDINGTTQSIFRVVGRIV